MNREDYAKTLEMDFKGVRGHWKLAPCTVFVGDERSGKSSAIQAIRAILAPQTTKRRDFKEAASPGREEPEATLVFEDAILSIGDGATDGSMIPAVAYSEILGHGPEKLRRAVLDRFGGADDLRLRVPEPLTEWAQTLVYPVTGASVEEGSKHVRVPVRSAGELLAEIGKAKRRWTSEIKGLEQAIKSAPEQAGAEVAEEIRRKVRFIEREIEKAEKEKKRLSPSSTKPKAIERRIQRDARKEGEARKERDVAFKRWAIANGLRRAFEKRVKTLREAQGRHDGDTLVDCPACGHDRLDIGDVEDVFADWTRKEAKEKARLEAAEEAISKSDQRWKATEQTVAAGMVAERINDLWNEKAKAQAKLEQFAEAEAAEARNEEIRDQIMAKETERKALDTFDDAARKTLQHAEDKAADRAASAVNAYMPRGIQVVIDRWAWRVQTASGDVSVAWAAGSERGALMLAIPLAWAREGEPVVVLLDDEDLAGFSAAGVSEVLAGLEDRVAEGDIRQVFATRHLDRAEEVPSTWHAIDVGKRRERS